MMPQKILIIGDGHLANRTNKLLLHKGNSVIHLPFVPKEHSESNNTPLQIIENSLNNLDIASFSRLYILFEKDEKNIETLISIIALYPNIPIAASVFNENIIPHLLKAHPLLTIFNPAKIAAPFFVEAIGQVQNQKKTAVPFLKKLPLRKKMKDSFLSILIVLFIMVILSSIAFFHFYEQLPLLDAIYFVVVTITTVGYGDINLLHSGVLTKIIGIMLVLSSFILVWLIFSLFIDELVKRRAQYLLGRKKYPYKNHIILCGVGRLGYFIALELINKGEKVVIIEEKEEANGVSYFRSLNVDVYNGNACRPDVLEDAGVKYCKALICVTNNDYINLEIGMNARYFQPDVRLILRIFDESMAAVIKDKFDIHLTKSMSFITAEKFASLV